MSYFLQPNLSLLYFQDTNQMAIASRSQIPVTGVKKPASPSTS